MNIEYVRDIGMNYFINAIQYLSAKPAQTPAIIRIVGHGLSRSSTISQGSTIVASLRKLELKSRTKSLSFKSFVFSMSKRNSWREETYFQRSSKVLNLAATARGSQRIKSQLS
jgi:hypothetical protein